MIVGRQSRAGNREGAVLEQCVDVYVGIIVNLYVGEIHAEQAVAVAIHPEPKMLKATGVERVLGNESGVCFTELAEI